MLDRALGAPPGQRERRGGLAAQGHGGGVVEQLLLGLARVALVGLVADGEIEARAAATDRGLRQLAQMRGAGAEARDLAVVVVASTW